MRVIENDEFRAALADVVSRYGANYVYNNSGNENAACDYYPNPDARDNRAKSGCLIGEACVVLGIDVTGIDGGVDTLNDIISSRYNISLDPEVINRAVKAQAYQDRGGEWGGAVQEYDLWSPEPDDDFDYDFSSDESDI